MAARQPGQPTRPKVLAIAFVVAALTLASSWYWARQRPLVLIHFFDQVAGLQVGDAVYLEGVRVGHVKDLRFAGRRVGVEIAIDAKYRDTVTGMTHFLLWTDELDPNRRALRAQPDTSRD